MPGKKQEVKERNPSDYSEHCLEQVGATGQRWNKTQSTEWRLATPMQGKTHQHSSLQSPGRGDGHSHNSCRLVSSLGPSKLSESRARGAWGQCNPRKLVSLHLWKTNAIKQDWIEGAQAGLLIHLATVGQSLPRRTYDSNMHTGRSRFLKVATIFVEIHVFSVGNWERRHWWIDSLSSLQLVHIALSRHF